MVGEAMVAASGNKRLTVPGVVFLLVLFFDQLSKLWVLRVIVPGQEIAVWPGFFNLVLTFNKGIAFGLLRDWPDLWRILFLAGAIGAAILVLSYLFFKDYREDLLGRMAIATILGGAAGNLVDRLRWGAVVDFLDFHYGAYHWPAFNVADSAVCLGVLLLLFRPPRGSVAEPPRGSAADQTTAPKSF